MLLKIFGYTVAFLILHLCGNNLSTPVTVDEKKLRYEEYYIEHELSESQARNAALSTDYNSIIVPPGCQPCTKEEKGYCLSLDLINDHCCCDKRYHEYLPFIPHTCYFGPKLCSTRAENCEAYSRVRQCCCDKFSLQKWKEKSGAESNKTEEKYVLIFMLNAIYIFVYYYIT